jgi:integrase
VFCYAFATGRIERDPSGDLRGALPPANGKHMATITDPKEIAGLLRSIAGYKGSIVTRCALQLAPLVFVRPGELRQAEWKEIDFEAAEWRIPAGKMKAGVLHIVPLSRQALAVLREIYPLAGLFTGTGSLAEGDVLVGDPGLVELLLYAEDFCLARLQPLLPRPLPVYQFFSNRHATYCRRTIIG